MVEFFTSFKRTIFSGSAITLVAGAWMFMLYHLKVIAKDISGDMGIFMDGMYTALMIVTAGILVYLFPVLSRFVMKTTAMAKLSFVMAIRFLPYTVLILVAAALMAWLIFYHLPGIFFYQTDMSSQGFVYCLFLQLECTSRSSRTQNIPNTQISICWLYDQCIIIKHTGPPYLKT